MLVANKKLKQRREAEKKTLHLGPLILPFVLPRLLSSFRSTDISIVISNGLNMVEHAIQNFNEYVISE